MERLWLGIFLLALLLVLGLWTAGVMNEIHTPLSQTLAQAGAAALHEDPDTGVSLARQAASDWARVRRGTAAVADHAPMDEIDSLFAEMEAYAQAGQTADFAACCAQLSRLLEAMAEAHSPCWWNFL